MIVHNTVVTMVACCSTSCRLALFEWLSGWKKANNLDMFRVALNCAIINNWKTRRPGLPWAGYTASIGGKRLAFFTEQARMPVVRMASSLVRASVELVEIGDHILSLRRTKILCTILSKRFRC